MGWEQAVGREADDESAKAVAALVKRIEQKKVLFGIFVLWVFAQELVNSLNAMVIMDCGPHLAGFLKQFDCAFLIARFSDCLPKIVFALCEAVVGLNFFKQGDRFLKVSLILQQGCSAG
ncbi:MAG: hypothetical protein ACREEM_17725 [Blastocatellia bacterium]